MEILAVVLSIGLLLLVIDWCTTTTNKKKSDGPASGDNAPSSGRASASGKFSRKGSKDSAADIEANQTPAVRICPRCGRQQPEGRIFCGECGERLKQQ